VHKNSGTSKLSPYLHKYSPAFCAGWSLNLKLPHEGVHFSGENDSGLHDPVASDQHVEQLLAATEMLNDPSGQAQHLVDPSSEAKVPC
jgi:hypothetical protein